MITYVNTVLVANENAALVSSTPTTSDAGKFIVQSCDPTVAAANQIINTKAKAILSNAIKVGLITSKTTKVHNADGTTTDAPVIKWSNIIKAADVKSYNTLSYAADTEDVVTINFRSLNQAVLTEYAKGGKRIIVRLTFKDLPTRFRKWTESYEYVTQPGDTVNSIVVNIVNMINKEWKRARVVASLATASAGSNPGDPDTVADTAAGSESGANTIKLTAMTYDDDNSVDTINEYNKVRFNANIYYTDPAAEGWEANNKFYPTGVEIVKTPGKTYAASAKLVRDREAQAMGYEGILNRGEGTWPIIKPAMNTVLSNHYNGVTLEFENMYRAADDIFRKTKQTLEVYVAGTTTALTDVLNAFITGVAS